LSPQLRLLAAGLLFSLGGALIKLCSFPSLERAGLRSLIAATTLFVLLPEARRWPRAGTLRLLPAYFGATTLFVVANSLTTAANAIFLQSTYPFWVALFGPLLLRERARRRDVAVLLCIAAGMALFFIAPARSSATAPDPRHGDLVALVSGLSYGLLLLGFRWLGRQGAGEAGAAVAWGNAFTGPIALLLMPLFDQQWSAGDATSWGAITVLGTLQVGLAYALVTRAMPHVPAVQASLILMIEPALNPLLVFAVHDERPHPLAIAGGALIVGAVVCTNLRRPPPPEPSPPPTPLGDVP
jgi:drug/metabolite transporter (DMT)-like permease